MITLGIDTSCDDTSAGVVRDGRTVLSSVVHSQVQIHHPHGGVVPELASREHIRNIMPVVEAALSKAGIQLNRLDGIAVTIGPGLVGALLVGLYYAKSLSYVSGVPLTGVNHLEGHILSIFLEEDAPPFPFVALTVSGGHTSIYHVGGYGRYMLMGQTLDDAAGEAFDKVAKISGLGYPGGVAIENMAGSGVPKIPFPRAYMEKDSLDFSFSGLKTAVALYMKQWRSDRDKGEPDITLADIAASFQEAVVDVLVDKVMAARKRTSATAIVLAGGVACNQRLRERLSQAAAREGVRVYFPRPAYCTDNGAMIAAVGYHRLRRGETLDMSADVRSKFPVESLPVTDSTPDPSSLSL
ncbi:MAG: tRNA (adenosine(37)-N6)-threonylcarbamoyltransferase complex transferase subunit TsaD [Desulfococcus sp. 4484_242]|nr:MAG: tRNA (adenosine(37)-N6)-threonylcarbamoyltransferase complex transferase subunit TsaD [Desulfococcus sp. 4484_242]